MPTDTIAHDTSCPVSARWGEVLHAAISPAPTERCRWHLVLVRQPGWQSEADWSRIAAYAREAEPRIATFIVNSELPHSYIRRQAARRPTLVFSPGRLGVFEPRRGRVYQGKLMSKFQQLR